MHWPGRGAAAAARPASARRALVDPGAPGLPMVRCARSLDGPLRLVRTLYGRIDTKSPTVYSSMVPVAGGEGGSTRHDPARPRSLRCRLEIEPLFHSLAQRASPSIRC